jgi:hypothetical protein
MSSPVNDPADEGVYSARQRLERWGIELSIDAVVPTIQITQELLRQSQLPTPPRAVETAVELTTIAAMMRVRYDEPELTSDEIGNFIGGLRQFMNSWFHE